MDPLKFSSEEEAIQYLSDVTGKKIKVARVPRRPAASGIEIMETSISLADDEPDVMVEFEYEQPESKSWDSPGHSGSIKIIEITRTDNNVEITNQLDKKQIEDLMEQAKQHLADKYGDAEAEYADYLYDRMKEEGI